MPSEVLPFESNTGCVLHAGQDMSRPGQESAWQGCRRS